MLGRIKYCVSHCPLYLRCDKLQTVWSECRNREWNCRKFFTMADWKRSYLGLAYCGNLSDIVLVAALSLGLYIRWAHSQDVAVLLIAFMGLTIFAVTGALVYYFSMRAVGVSVARLWLGCLIGVVAFPEADIYPSELIQSVHEAMDVLLVTSLVMKVVWAFSQRVLHLNTQKPQLVNNMDALEMIGLAISSLVVGKDFLSITVLVMGLGLTVTAIRTRSFLGLLNFIALILVTSIIFFPKLLMVPANACALSLFAGRMSTDAILDLYFSSLTTLERWEPLFKRSRLTQRLFILVLLVLELTFFILNAVQMPNHKEWFIVVPMYGAFGVIWFCYHLVFLVTCWQLSGKISECNATFVGLEENAKNMRRILASKGVRHFSLISQRLVMVALLTTIIVAGLSWQTKTAVSISLWMVVLPLEICILSLLWEMGTTLGGTCVGYGVLAPCVYRKSKQTATVLPAGTVEALGTRITNTLNTVQQFFSYHLLDMFGCDFSSSGLTSDALCSKLKAFFQQCTNGGPRYDTYLLYYSGPVYENGDWALSDKERLKFETLLDWWRDVDCYSGARLVLVLDTEYSYKWLKEVRRLNRDIVGLQTCYFQASSADVENPTFMNVGDFTADWMDYNMCNMRAVEFQDKDRQLRAIYTVSKSWTDFTFHLPTEQDIQQHWSANFPQFTKILIRVTNFPQVGNVLCCCGCVLRCLKRKRMLWLPPLECDTDHGFKLIRS